MTISCPIACGTNVMQRNVVNGKKMRYVQPPVREMIRPPISYKQPTIPIDSDTVHKTSYLPIDRAVALLCRLPPATPEPNLGMNREVKMDSQTVTSTSFPPIVGLQRSLTTVPPNRIVMGTGPMQKMTTQKHDYVSKRGQRSGPIRPLNGMIASTEPIESDTTASLSYAPPAGFIPAVNCKPSAEYKLPEVDMDLETCHKLSFTTPHTKPREIPGWAMKPRFVKPLLPMDSNTIQKCSYRPPGVLIEIDATDDDNEDNRLRSVEYYAKAGL